ncbi:MAG: hypothetical protein ACPHP8_09105, partial [Luminiphilus sp.]
RITPRYGARITGLEEKITLSLVHVAMPMSHRLAANAGELTFPKKYTTHHHPVTGKRGAESRVNIALCLGRMKAIGTDKKRVFDSSSGPR